ncbi:ABC transporter permease [Rhizobium mayense]|uniref:Transport permease protein n=2 Tax=Rhizobium mayense TaxID=1312184 RepID=A0ABT7K5M1_9HYPH|nr:ABC transporter permease [Rhizobium mayense]MDL2403914.1 ABC transporter permease [Rhizobium mayense]
MLRSLWQYRQFIISSIRNDLVNRFTRSRLGALWIILNPLAQVAIYALVLSNVVAAKLPDIDNKYGYAIYLMAGLLGWNLFSEVLNRSLFLFIEYGNLMKKVQFPRITLPVIVAGTNLVNNALLFVAMMGIFAIVGHRFTLQIIWLVPLTIILVMFALGLGIILGLINVFVRDLGQAVPIILQILFWFTPIVYPLNIIPAAYRHLLKFNPIYHFTSAYQSIIAYGEPPNFISLLLVTLIAALMLFLSLFLFRRANGEMVDVL